MAFCLYNPRRQTLHDVVAIKEKMFEVAKPFKWIRFPDGVENSSGYFYNTKTSKVELKPLAPPRSVIIDPTPGTLDVVQLLLDTGVLMQAQIPVEWKKLLDNKPNG